jgi:hypothetical protein
MAERDIYEEICIGFKELAKERNMARQSQAWKNLERNAAKICGGKRVYRGGDFSKEDVDVEVEDLPFMRIDAKYRTRHAHHTFMKEIIRKYCTKEGDTPVLFTKTHHQDGCYVTITGEFFEELLNALRATKGK